MEKAFELERRKPIWNVVSEFYLDTELNDGDYDRIAKTLIQADSNIDRLKAIDRYEVFPVLKGNLLSPTGIWSGFQEEWLHERCCNAYLKKNKRSFRFKTKIYHKLLNWMTKDHWKEIERRI